MLQSPSGTIHRRAWAMALLGALVALGAAPQLLKLEKAKAELFADRSTYAPGSEARLAVVLTIDEGWHTNSHEPTYDYLIPTEVALALPEGWPEPSVTYPEGTLETFAFADEPLSVYSGSVTILATLRVPADATGDAAGRVPVEATVRYQACDDRSCLPPVTTRVDLLLAVGAEGEAIHPEVFSEGAPPAGGTGPAALPVRLPWILALAILGGLILNAMPCVLPVLSLKVFGLVRSAGAGRGEIVRGALATSLGILLSFLGLALAAILARRVGAAVGWGVQFQEPTFVVALAVIMVLFSLNLWGLFEITLPTALAQAAGAGQREGVLGHLTTGLFATLMATPCSAPFLGTAVGFALAQDAVTVLAVFTAVGLGMALPYLLLAVAPRTAEWLPKPGPWMVRFKAFMGFLLFAAVIWLLYVLANQLATARVAFIELALLGLALGIWLRQRAAGRVWRRLGALAAVAASVGALALAHGGRGEAATPAAESRSLISWTRFDRSEAEGLAAEGRLVFVDVTADWCFTCKVNERLVLETEEVSRAFAEHDVVAMKADWTNRDPEIADFLADHGRYGVPFYLLYRPGRPPHIFSELLTKGEVVARLAEAASGGRAAIASIPSRP